MKAINSASRTQVRPHALAVGLNVLLGMTAVAAIGALVLEYGGFSLSAEQLGALHIGEALIVAVLVLDRVLRVLLAVSRRAYLRENWIDFGVILLAAVAVVAGMRTRIVSLGALYVFISQAYILVALVIRGVNINLHFAGSGIHPSILLLGSFLFLCLAGSGLLMLPAATPAENPINFVDAVFTATSATCVTGLIVRGTGSDFTFFGQAVILILIQLGGLGIMVFGTMLAMLMGKGISLRGSGTLGQMLARENLGGLGRAVVFVMVVTFCLELAGAGLFYPMFASPQGGSSPTTARAVWDSVFHSISSFCNAGFSLYDQNMLAGVRDGWARPLRGHWQILGVMAPLIVLGGLGFPVLMDCARRLRCFAGGLVRSVRSSAWRWHSPPSERLSLHSRVVLITSAALIVLGAVGLILLEPIEADRYGAIGRNPLYDQASRRQVDWPGMSPTRRLREAVFQSITARTAGFNTIACSELSDAGKGWLCGLMIIGGSPASTAGGMKTVTVALLIATAYCVLRRRRDVEFFRRSLPAELLRRATAVAVLYLGLVAVVTLLLSVAMRSGYNFIDLLFEAASACGTVGLSTGVTRGLNLFGKLVIVGGMFIGRLGPLTLLLALTSGLRQVDYAYPSENVVIG